MSEKKSVPLEIECPICGMFLFCRLTKAEDYPNTCVCGAKLNEPDYEDLDRFIRTSQFKKEIQEKQDAFISRKYCSRVWERTDAYWEMRKREDDLFLDASTVVKVGRFGRWPDDRIRKCLSALSTLLESEGLALSFQADDVILALQSAPVIGSRRRRHN